MIADMVAMIMQLNAFAFILNYCMLTDSSFSMLSQFHWSSTTMIFQLKVPDLYPILLQMSQLSLHFKVMGFCLLIK